MSCLTVIQHPLLTEKICRLRNKNTSTRDFRQLVDEISSVLVYEATRDVTLVQSGTLETPVSKYESLSVANKFCLIPIWRSGSGMLNAAQAYFPDASVFHLGLFREHKTLEPIEYYNKLPSKCSYDECLVLDPMIATGGTADAAISILKDWGVPKIRFLAICASTQGLERLANAHPDVDFFVACKDPELSSDGYVTPGIGDVGDRLYSTIMN